MGRMIDVEGLVKAINEQENCYVVRCGDCKHWRSYRNSEDTYESMGVCTHPNWNRGIDEPTKDIVNVRGSFFCGYGDEIDPIHEEGEEHETN